MVAAKVIPSPVGYAQVITFTTHKTLCGPSGACIITHDSALAKKIDRGVFPGEQGGPHVHVFAALATTFKLAKTEQFTKLQKQIVVNCKRLTDQLQKRSLKIAYGGTDTHLINIDCKTVIGDDGTPLSGDLAARILDIAGIVLNRNTIPGDKTALYASGIRLGTPWVTQRGLKEPEMVKIADIIADVMTAIKPYKVDTKQGPAIRAKLDFQVLENTKIRVRILAEQAGIDYKPTSHAYPHYFFIDDEPASLNDLVGLDISGINTRQFVNFAFESNSEELEIGDSQRTKLQYT